MFGGRVAVLVLVAELSSVLRAHLAVPSSGSSSDALPDDCDHDETAPPPPPPPPSSSHESLERLLISFLPALTENKGRSKHVVGAFQCALEVSQLLARSQRSCR